MSQINIRHATEEDVGEIFRMVKCLAEYLKEQDAIKITAETLRQNLHMSKFLVVEDLTTSDSASKSMIGFASYSSRFNTYDGHIAILDNLYVESEYRNKGIGSKLLDTLLQEVSASGCSEMEFVVNSWNSEAIEFYNRKGAVNVTEPMKWHLYRMPISK